MKNTYVAFFRGINVGGKVVKMAQLKLMFEKCGFSDVKTVIQSGNVIFESATQKEQEIINKISTNFVKFFGFEAQTIVKTKDKILGLIKLNPFENVAKTKDTRQIICVCSAPPVDCIHQTGENFTVEVKTHDFIAWHFTKTTLGPPKFYQNPLTAKDIVVTQRSWAIMCKLAKLL